MKIHYPTKTFFISLTLCCFSLFFLAGYALAEEEYEDEHEGGAIELSQEQIERAGIGLADVGTGSIRDILPVYGEIVANAESVQSVNARYEGLIRTVTKSIGDTVRRGETLVTVEANDSLKDYAVVSSLDGIITQRNANVGEQTASRTLFVVENFATVWVNLSLFPKDVPLVQRGQQVRISNVDRTKTAQGQIIYIAPSGNSTNQAVIARVLIENPDRFWKPGQFVSAEITLAEALAPLAIRNEALQIVEGETVVFVKGEEGFEPRPIALGRTDGELSEVVRGLQENETYVTANSFLLKAELGKGDIEDDD